MEGSWRRGMRWPVRRYDGRRAAFVGPAGFGSDAGDDIGAGPILPAFDEGARTVAYA